jgi:alkanesulfonate monooxygenase SsuD/methylene tetrahydromethanopterin reductase-like flavin-dependent oxidoreductase (luciferase family)
MATIDIGVGLPNNVDDVTRRQLIRWARVAEDMGASSLCCTDRVMYPSLETMLTLAAVSSVTERVKLMTSVLIAPLRTSGALFRKQIDTLDMLTDRRLVLAVGVGRRQDDYDACAVEYNRRGRILDAQLSADGPPVHGMTAGRASSSLGDALGSRLLFGGDGPATLRRIQRYGGGWVAAAGLGAWSAATAFAADVRGAWAAAGRSGVPRLVAMVYTSAGPNARDEALRHMHSYYAFLGPQRADELARHVITDLAQLSDTRDQLADAGFHELLLLPTSAELSQLDALKVALN